MRVLFVCLGNICRSAMAEGVFARIVSQRGLGAQVQIDSAGTGDWHVGEPPDRRAREMLARHGIDISNLRARQVNGADFDAFDLLLAMDRDNLATLKRTAPDGTGHKVRLFLDFAPDLAGTEVPDPYFGGPDGFEQVFELVEAGANGLADHIAGNSS